MILPSTRDILSSFYAVAALALVNGIVSWLRQLRKCEHVTYSFCKYLSFIFCYAGMCWAYSSEQNKLNPRALGVILNWVKNNYLSW